MLELDIDYSDSLNADEFLLGQSDGEALREIEENRSNSYLRGYSAGYGMAQIRAHKSEPSDEIIRNK